MGRESMAGPLEYAGSSLSPRPEDAIDPRSRSLALNREAGRVAIPPPPDYTPTDIPAPPAEKQRAEMSFLERLTTPSPREEVLQRGPFGLPNIPSPPVSLALPPAASFLGRLGLQAGGAALEPLLRGETDPTKLGTEAAKGAAFSAAAETALGPLGRFIGRQVGASRATKGYEAAKKAAGLEEIAKKEAFEKATLEHGEKAAADIATGLFENVPALKGMQASGKGLYDAIYGAGREKVSAAFDESLKEVVKRGAGRQVQLPSEIAERLGFEAPAGMSQAAIDALQRAGRLPKGAAPPGMTSVDAADLAKRATGLWKKDAGTYRAAASALDAAGIGDPTARASYKAYVGISEFIDKAKALSAEGVLSPQKLMTALSNLKMVELIRRRGLGSGTEGAIQRAARGGPLAPAPPPSLIPPEITAHNIPPWYRHLIGAGVGGGIAGWPGAAAGGLLGHVLVPERIVTKGPIAPGITQAARTISGPLAAGARNIAAPYLPEGQP